MTGNGWGKKGRHELIVVRCRGTHFFFKTQRGKRKMVTDERCDEQSFLKAHLCQNQNTWNSFVFDLMNICL